MIFRQSVSLAINAGGMGRRLGGVAKGLLEVGGLSVIERLLRLRGLFADVFLVANDAAPYRRFQVRTVPDEVVGRGAPGGVVTALGASLTPWVLVVACDMPFVTADAVGRLLEAGGPAYEVVCASRGGNLEPLCALYRRDLYSRWKQELAAEPALRSLVAGARFMSIELSADLLDSLNTPEDLARWAHRS